MDQNGGGLWATPRSIKKDPLSHCLPSCHSRAVNPQKVVTHLEECPEAAPEGRCQALGPRAQWGAARVQSWRQSEGCGLRGPWI